MRWLRHKLFGTEFIIAAGRINFRDTCGEVIGCRPKTLILPVYADSTSGKKFVVSDERVVELDNIKVAYVWLYRNKN